MAADTSIVLMGYLIYQGNDILLKAIPNTNTGTPYSVPEGRKLIITEISLTNMGDISQTATIRIGEFSIVPNITIPPHEGIVQSRQTQLLYGHEIAGSASTANSVVYYISGLEVDA